VSNIKLTKAQREWLGLIDVGMRRCLIRYRPHVALCMHGLATNEEQVCRSRFASSAITPAGRAWLAANQRRKK